MSDPVLNRAPVAPSHNTSQAFQAILQANLDYFLGWAPIAYEGKNLTGVHQARVAFRRSRSAVTIFRKVVGRAAGTPIALELKWIAGEMGAARDIDVFISEGIPDVAATINDPAGQAKLEALAQKKQAVAYTSVRAMLDSDRYKKFIAQYKSWIADEAWRKVKGANKKQLDQPVTQFASKILEQVFNKILTQGERLAQMSDEELHELRKACKKMRYATEFFTPLYDGAAVSEFTGKFKAVQKLLGLINDVAVMPTLLNELVGDADAQTKKFSDSLAELRRKQQAEAKEALMGTVWKELVEVKRPWK
jgi:CHAD domain-containing protein